MGLWSPGLPLFRVLGELRVPAKAGRAGSFSSAGRLGDALLPTFLWRDRGGGTVSWSRSFPEAHKFPPKKEENQEAWTSTAVLSYPGVF